MNGTAMKTETADDMRSALRQAGAIGAVDR